MNQATKNGSGSEPDSEIPEQLEVAVMEFILKHTRFVNLDGGLYIIDDISTFASALIREYGIK